MPAERTPHQARVWLARPLVAATRVVLRAPRLVILLALALAFAAAVTTKQGLGFRTSRLDLLNPQSSYNRRWLDYLDEFGQQDDLVVVVEGTGREAVLPVLDEVAASLSARPQHFESVFWHRELAAVRRKALHFLDLGHLHRIDQWLDEFEPVLQGHWDQLNAVQQLASVVDDARPPHSAVQPAAHTEASGVRPRWQGALQENLARRLGDRPLAGSPWQELNRLVAGLQSGLSSDYLLADEGRLGFVLAKIPRSPEQQSATLQAVRQLRQILDKLGDRHPHIRIGATGMPILESDEMLVSKSDTLWASLLSLTGVVCVFAAGFGGLRRPLLAVSMLVVGLIWTCGYVTLSVGHLNILSVSFGMILIGLGIDFGIHYIAQYSQQVHSSDNREAALTATAASVGPGIVTGAVTTALAFYTAALTDFTGLAELGVIAGGGIVLCMLATVLVLPACIMLVDPWPSCPVAEDGLPFAALFARISRSGRRVTWVTVAVTVALGAGLSRLEYDHNLLNLQPARSQGVELERRISSRVNRGVWYALSMSASRQELLARKQRLESLPVVARTEEVATLLAEPAAAQTELIARIRRRLAGLPAHPPLISVGRQVDAESLLRRLAAARPAEAQIRESAELTRRMPAGDYFRRVSAVQQQAAAELLGLLRSIRSMADPLPPSARDLPAQLARRFIGRSGQYLLRVYGHGEIWDTVKLREFVEAVEGVDPEITGHPIQTYYAARQMQHSYLQAAVYSLLAVSVVLMIDFRRFRYVLLSMLPMALGMLQMFGLLGWLGIPLNPANLIVLPLILGIGIDDGVHVVHDYLRRTGSSYRLSSATAMAVVLTSATTMIGFGSMMMASHRGLRSLGQVLTLGVFCCLGSSLIVLPPLLRWLGTAFSANELVDKLEDSTPPAS